MSYVGDVREQGGSSGAPDGRVRSRPAEARENWLSSLNWQLDFYRNPVRRLRIDPEFEWEWLEKGRKRRSLKSTVLPAVGNALRINRIGPSGYQEWINANSGLLWEARTLLEDDLSRLLFDGMLVLRACGHGRYYFPRIEFEDLVRVVAEAPFDSKDLPVDYLGLPLRVFRLEFGDGITGLPVTVISTKVQIGLLNSYRQYFVRRGPIDFIPSEGDVVLDCGACIGEVSILMAGLAGPAGQVHLFDPVPLHARYCRLQASLNPAISETLRINTLAVGSVSREAGGSPDDSSSISPGGLAVSAYPTTSLDDYVDRTGLQSVDFIKMDIEGAEMEALAGAAGTIREFRPRMAVSAYHKPEDLWEIPHRLKELHNGYRLFFGHHSPIEWESVFYAV